MGVVEMPLRQKANANGFMAVCDWSYDEVDDAWIAACDPAQRWQFPDGDPKENGMKFCPFCGKPLLQNEDAIPPTATLRKQV
jgi:hypothetical protein